MRQLKQGALLSYVNIILNIAVGLMLTPFIIRSLGDSEYGLYTLIGSFVAYLSLMDLGLNNTIIRFVSKYIAEGDKLREKMFLGTTMKIYGLISIILIVIGLILYFNLDAIFNQSLKPEELEKAKIMFLILVFNIAITLPGGAFTAICNAYENFVFPRLISVIRYIFRAGVVVAILYLGGKAVSLVLIDTAFNLIVIAITYNHVVRKLKVTFNFSTFNTVFVKKILSYSVWIFIMGLISIFQWNSGQLILGIKTNTVTVAIYGIGIMLGGYYGSFSSVISQLLLPKANQMNIHNSNDEILAMMIKIGRISFMIVMYMFLGFITVGKEFVILWVGPSYINAWYIAVIIMTGYSIPLIQGFAGSLIEANNKVAYKAIPYFFGLSFGLILGYYLMAEYNEIGIAIGLTIGWMLAQIVMNIIYQKILKLNILAFFKGVFSNTLLPIIFVGILCNILNYFVPNQNWYYLIVKILGITILYWSAMYFISMEKEEKAYLLKS